MLKHIPQSWKDDMRTNFAHEHNFYINPRGRVLPALTSAGVSYIKNDATTNMRGTYRMQCGASTDLTYLYTLPQRFIIEGWFKPEFAYDGATKGIFSDAGGVNVSLYYTSSTDQLIFGTAPGADILSTAFTSNAELQKWIYVRCYFDNTSKLKGFYCTVNGIVYADSQNVPGAGPFVPLNTITILETAPSESSYWIIHELDETLATGEYKTYQADRQIIFDFNGTTLGRERIRIPTLHTATEHRGVKSFNLSKSVENPMTGSAGANTASMTLLNINGQFSDDQYDAFDPFNGRYNGTQKYLQNRVQLEIESQYSRSGATTDIPNGTPVYIQTEWATIDSWVISGTGATASVGNRIVEITRASATAFFTRNITISNPTTKYIILRIKGIGITGSVRVKNETDATTIATLTIKPTWEVFRVSLSSAIADPVLAITLAFDTTGSYEIDWIYIGDGSELTDPMSEPIFIGRTTPGAFKRSSPSKFYGDVSINIEDGISELGETKLRRAYAFDAYDLCDPAAESDSLVHSIARLVTKKEIRNYALNSSFENATIANSWASTGLTLTRDNTYAQFGTYSAKAVAIAANQIFYSTIDFQGEDKIDVGDVFNFSAYIRQDTASNMRITLRQYNSAGAFISEIGSTTTSANVDIFERVNVSGEISSPLCAILGIFFYSNDAGTFYVDGVMLTRGIDPIDYFLLNATDGASGAGSADLAATVLYDTVAFDCDAVDVEHPYALVDRGSTAWDALKKIGDASIASYIGMSPDGVFQFKVRYNSDDMPNLGDVEDFGGIATSLDVQGANAVKVHGVIINGTSASGSTPTKQIWSGEASGIFQTDDAGKILHPISDAAYMSVSGATEIELKYSEDL